MKTVKKVDKKTNMFGDFKKNYGKSMALTILLLFSVLAALNFPANLSAQSNDDIKFEHISIEQKLSQSTASCIIQDNYGFMWFGTQNGLNRYDGHEFKTYNSDSKIKDTLSRNLVISICKEESGILWIGTLGGGLNKFDPKTEKFTNHRNDKNFEPLKNENIRVIHVDQEKILWISTDNGLYKKKLDDGEEFKLCTDCKNSSGKIIKEIRTIYEDNKAEIWIGTDDGLYKYNRSKDTCKHYPIELENPFKNEVRAICEDQSGVFWIGTVSGLYQFDREGEKFTLHPGKLSGKQISKIYKDKDEIIWIGTRNNGLIRFDTKGGGILPYKNIPNDFTSLSNNNVSDIYQDKSGSIWIGTAGGGINKFDPGGKKFNLYKSIPGDPDSLSNNEVRGICEDKKGGIWVGNRGGGINKFDLVSKKFKPYLIGDAISQNPRRNDVNLIHADHFGNIWVGTFQAGLYRFVPGEGKFYLYVSNSIGEGERILTLYEDKEGFLWVAIQDGGLIKLDKDKERKELHPYKYESNSLSNNNVFAICEDHSGMLWIGTGGGGLNKLDKKTGQFSYYLPKKGNEHSLSHDFITAIYEDNSGILWIGTGGGGLNKLVDREKGIFNVYKTKDGLPNNVIYDILEDNKGNLWLSTNRGLSKFNPTTGKSRNYTISDGLQGYEFNRGAAWYSEKSGMMFFGGFDGFNAFEPGKMVDISSPPPPPIVITSFKKLNKNVPLSTSISEIKELILSYKDNFISFGFAALSFSDPENNRYAYKLEPINKEWIKWGNKHYKDFTGLGSGKYTFRVKGADSRGVWNEEGTSIEITITPPFWKTRWFYALLILALLSGVFTAIKVRTRTIEIQKTKLQELVVERTDEINQQKEELKKTNFLLKQEIDVRKQTDASLKESEERYRTLIETSPDAIILSEAKDGGIIFANPQCMSLSGYNTVEEMREHVNNIFDYIDEKGPYRADENAERIKKGGHIKNNEYTIRSKDGTPIAVEIRTALTKDAEGKPRYLLSVIRDIRERKEAEKQEKLNREKLIQSEKMASIGKLVSGVAHELNNPLAAIKMNSEIFDRVWHEALPVLDEHYEKDKNFSLASFPYMDAKKRLEDLITGLTESSQRIEKIVDDLRDYSRPGDSLTSEREPTDINKAIEFSVNLTNNLIKKSTKHFSLELTKNLPHMQGNFQKLQQVFINLIQNACQALTDNSRKIEISTTYEKKKKKILIKVKDEGKGIKEEDKKYITDPFFTTNRDQGGTGLGLSISLQIIKDHKGSMDFQSEVGKGTTVTVTLPVNE